MSAVQGCWTDLKYLRKVHDTCSENYERQTTVNITQLCVCIGLLLPTVFAFVRIFYLKERVFLVQVISTMILGELAGITIAALMQRFFNIAKDWNTFVAIAYSDP